MCFINKVVFSTALSLGGFSGLNMIYGVLPLSMIGDDFWSAGFPQPWLGTSLPAPALQWHGRGLPWQYLQALVALAAFWTPPLPFLLCYNKGIKQIYALDQACSDYLGCAVRVSPCWERLSQGSPGDSPSQQAVGPRAGAEDEHQHGTQDGDRVSPNAPEWSQSQRRKGGERWDGVSQVLSCETWHRFFEDTVRQAAMEKGVNTNKIKALCVRHTAYSTPHHFMSLWFHAAVLLNPSFQKSWARLKNRAKKCYIAGSVICSLKAEHLVLVCISSSWRLEMC